MQELIEWITAEVKRVESLTGYSEDYKAGMAFKLLDTAKKAIELLPKERQAIEEAADANTVECEHYDSHVWKYKSGSDYFTTRYKQ